jgi:hypothetical protein
MNKTFDAVAFRRNRREEFSRAYAGLSAEQIEERVQQTLEGDPLWKQRVQTRAPLASKKNTVDCPYVPRSKSDAVGNSNRDAGVWDDPKKLPIQS